MMEKLAFTLGYKQERVYSYYLQANDGVEDVNKYLKAILEKNIWQSKKNQLIMLHPSLWAY